MSLPGLRSTTSRLLIAATLVWTCAATAQKPAASTEDRIAENLNLRFANGIAAIAEEKVITVDDLRREIMPFVPQLQNSSRSEQEFNQKLQQLQEEVLQELIDRVLIVKEFYKDEKHRVPESVIDNQIAEQIISDFDGDRSKFLSYLRSRGMSQKEYRREVEERTIYDYMRHEKSKSATTVSPVQIETFYKENKEHFYQEDAAQLRLIQIVRRPDDTDATFDSRTSEVMKHLREGTNFADVARLYSEGPGRNKGGEMGWLRTADLNKEFIPAVNTLTKGQYTEPIKAAEGAYIFFLEDRKTAGIQPIDEVRDQIERMLIQRNGQQAQERWLERLRRNGYVKHF